MRTLNFRTLCQEYGISAKTGYKWRSVFGVKVWPGWKKNRGGREAIANN